MGYPVSYSGAIEVQPPLSDAHAKLVEVCVDLEGSEDLRPTDQGKTDPRKDSLIDRDPGMRSFITDVLSRSDAANAKRIRPTDY